MVLAGLSGPAFATPPSFADVHLHFNWDQKEIISAREAVERLKANNVVLAVVSSTPSALALELAATGQPWIRPFFSPYLTVAHRDLWIGDEIILTEAEKGLSAGLYNGIGELHISYSFGPRRNNKILTGLLELAARFDVPFSIHTEASSNRLLMPICRDHSNVRFLWAHAGGILGPGSIDDLMQQCPNVWAEVSVRDPWRYDTLVDENNRLLPGWRELMIKYQDRFMTGTDPVWRVTRDRSWDMADEGWDHYDRLVEFHRNWLKQLPAEVEEKIRLKNAELFFAKSVSD